MRPDYDRVVKSVRQPPDALEKGLRFGCGGFLGLVFFLMLGFRLFSNAGGAFAACVIVGTLATAWLAMRYGDMFWKSLGWGSGWFWWWPWW